MVGLLTFIASGIHAYGASGNLNSAGSVWSGYAEDATIIVKYSGVYSVSLIGESSFSGENKGGKIIAEFYFKAGDRLDTKRFEGSTNSVYTSDTRYKGGDGILLLVNNKKLIGAGGAGGDSHDHRNGTIWSGHSCTSVNNDKFGGGGGGLAFMSGGGYAVGNSNPDSGAKGGLYNDWSAGAGSNFLDVSALEYLRTHFVGMSSGEISSFEIKSLDDPAQNPPTVSIDLTEVIDILKSIYDQTILLLNSDKSSIPSITVIANQTFSKLIEGYKNDDGGTHGTIQLSPVNKDDGIMRVTGKLNTLGSHVITINNKNYLFHVVEEPTSDDISVVF